MSMTADQLEKVYDHLADLMTAIEDGEHLAQVEGNHKIEGSMITAKYAFAGLHHTVSKLLTEAKYGKK